MSFEINWYRNFFNISWAREQDKLVLLVVFEDKKVATNVAKEIESWSEKFTRLTIIEKEQDEFGTLVRQGKRAFEAQNYRLSLKKFQQSLKINPEAKLPKEKIKEINKILDENSKRYI